MINVDENNLHTEVSTMTKTDSTITPRSFKNLSDMERGELNAYVKLGLSFTEIGVKMNRHKSTISREYKRGSVQQIKPTERLLRPIFPMQVHVSIGRTVRIAVLLLLS